ncbi:MAG: MucBP domain-containing protein [Levilactobacillus sp.]|jgi:LPXTG-motif cell wall-anchored protein|uniref:MucBP domain-containing protein n=1 Tax=Levilactobacillus sp. TaxID=2767919 RepID=UPI002587146B|nr:MucBP domain-containing protein [Levilactobacillus sp.]MCI1553330.1 MucBP domain-containing protein [Levilactobacillus sp.]MCI1598503.1 MucBP domain-containing protein [Levilactobacillus sp.]MCI1606823.1 MucBP domain-containing protein [Levilactobacillus sp.]
MFNEMNTKEHYKMYKKGKAWVFAGIVTATLALGVAGGPTAHADTTGAAESDQESESGQSATPAKTATLSSTTKQASTENETENPSTDDATTSETTTTGEQDQTPAAAKTDTAEAPTAKTTTETPAKPETPVKSATPAPTSKTPTPTKDVTATITKPVTKITTAVTPNMRIKAPTRTKMMHTARAMAPAAPTTPAPTATAAVTAATPVTEADESIDQWMPDKNLQQVVLHRLERDYDISSVDQITKQMLSTLVSFYSDLHYEQANEDYHNAVLGIRSLQGLEYATNLQDLSINPDLDASLSWNGRFVYGSISDISALANLKKLTDVNLQMNSLSDISALKNLKLHSVSLSYNQLYDISALQNSIDTLASYSPMSYQVIKFPQVVLNSDTYTLPSFVVTNAQGQNVPIAPEVTSQNFGLASDGVGTNLDSQTVTWKLNASQGYLFMNWHDSLFGLGGYPFEGEIVVPYRIDDTVGNVNVTFKNENGLSLAPQVTLAGTLGDSFDLNQSANVMAYVQQIMQKGYSFIGTENNAPITGTYTKDPTNITLLFGVKSIDTTFNFLDENGNKIADSQTMKGDYGQDWQVAVPGLTGYTFTKAEKDGEELAVTDGQLSGTLATDSTINLIYAANDETATVHYVYADGSEAAPSKQVTGKYGDSINFPESPAIGGYTASDLAPAKFGDGDEANTFTVTYTKDSTVTPPTNPEQTITVTVHYQTADGTQVAPDVVITGKTGDAYTTSPATNVLDGYELVSTPANATGTMGDSDITVTYLYTNTGDGDQVNPEPGTPTTPTKPTKPTTEPDMVTPTKPTPSAKPQPVTGGQADTVSPAGKRTPAAQNGQQGAAATVALAATATKQPATPATATKTTLPQTDEQSTSPLWGLALLGGLLGLVGFKRRKRN